MHGAHVRCSAGDNGSPRASAGSVDRNDVPALGEDRRRRLLSAGVRGAAPGCGVTSEGGTSRCQTVWRHPLELNVTTSSVWHSVNTATISSPSSSRYLRAEVAVCETSRPGHAQGDTTTHVREIAGAEGGNRACASSCQHYGHGAKFLDGMHEAKDVRWLLSGTNTWRANSWTPDATRRRLKRVQPRYPRSRGRGSGGASERGMGNRVVARARNE